jgi:hypothetical protein
MNGIIALAILLTSAVPSFDVQTLDGRTIAGSLAELTPDRLTIAAKEGDVSLDTQVVLTLSSKQKRKLLLPASGVVVELTDGSVIRGRQYLAGGSRAQIALADGKTVETPVSAVRTVQLERTSDALGGEWSRLIGMKVDADLLIVRAGENLDYHKGVLHDVTEDVVRFDLDGEILPVKRSKVVGFVYRHGAESPLPAAVCRIGDSFGSQWSVREFKLGRELRWTTPAGLSVAQPLDRVVQIDFSAGKLAYVSDLKPESIVWTPYFGVGSPLPAAQRLYAPRFDRGFQSSPLQLGGTVYSKGLALYCRTELVYRLPGRFGRFHAIAGIDDAVRPNGMARLVIRGDDRVLLDVVVSDSAPPRAIDLDVKNVRRLTIVADFAGSLAAGDRLLLCNARIVK